MAIVEFTIVPLGTGDTSISKYVAECHKILAASKLKYELTAMGTIVEGDLDEVLAIIMKMHEVPFTNKAKRVSTTIKIDDRRDKTATIENKVSAVLDKLEEE
ncbi:MAG: MTH1187 family thiamine-binding protein [Clostridia bacterium]|nr:MTH1187 family thiamine-binding protein [Clostridia bacterium]